MINNQRKVLQFALDRRYIWHYDNGQGDLERSVRLIFSSARFDSGNDTGRNFLGIARTISK
jgi:hypothetical protein